VDDHRVDTDTDTDTEDEVDWENLAPISDQELAEQEARLDDALGPDANFGEEPDPPPEDPEATLEVEEGGGKKPPGKKKESETERRRRMDAELMDRQLQESGGDVLDADDTSYLDTNAEGLTKVDKSEARRRASHDLFEDSFEELGSMVRPGPREGGTGYRFRNNTNDRILGIQGGTVMDIEGVQAGPSGKGVYSYKGRRHGIDAFYPHIRQGTLLFEKGSAQDERQDPQFASQGLQAGFSSGGGGGGGGGGDVVSDSQRREQLISRKADEAKRKRAQIRSLKGDVGGRQSRRGDTGGAREEQIAELSAQADKLEQEVVELKAGRDDPF